MVKKKQNKKRITRKRTRSKRKRVSKSQSFFVSFFNLRWQVFKKTMRREQGRCLRYKKYKNKYAFCFVWALLNKYFKQTVIVVVLLACLGLFFLRGTFLEVATQGVFGPELQTGLIQDLENKITMLTGQIHERKKCIEDEYWKDSINDVCNFYLYKQENEHCAKFRVPTERIAIGTKMCCDGGKGDIYNKNADKLTACPGADIFFHKKRILSTSVVPDQQHCQLGACEFYPAKGFHAKLNEDGSIQHDGDGNIIVEKDCPATTKVSACDKPCGGGKRIRTTRTTTCLDVKTTEVCNMQACLQEGY